MKHYFNRYYNTLKYHIKALKPYRYYDALML